jgi:hypothetical protein
LTFWDGKDKEYKCEIYLYNYLCPGEKIEELIIFVIVCCGKKVRQHSKEKKRVVDGIHPRPPSHP